MPGLVPGIFFGVTKKDRRDEPGDDVVRMVERWTYFQLTLAIS